MTVVISRRSTKQGIGTLEIEKVGPGAPRFKIDQTNLAESIDKGLIEEIGRSVMNAGGLGGDLCEFRWDLRR